MLGVMFDLIGEEMGMVWNMGKLAVLGGRLGELGEGVQDPTKSGVRLERLRGGALQRLRRARDGQEPLLK